MSPFVRGWTVTIFVIAFGSLAVGRLAFARVALAQEPFERADDSVVRLQPSAFHSLPRDIRKALEDRACTIPQSAAVHGPHNVVRGEFQRRGQSDWAVLCSRARISTILLFWNGSAKHVDSIATRPDRIYLQAMPEGIVYSRAISRATPRNRSFYGRRAPLPLHDGIEDSFMEKASTVWYRHLGAWMKFSGSN